ncbi:response regulator [Leptolyngbya sp. AN03gr2]|uniref:response regulator n=1 Tax=unclassified Leptolyngbya TaxID=2650499 RepID=UPI003D31086F
MSIQQILVIDDEDDLRNLIQTCLELMGGWQVLSANCGKEGLLKAQTEQPDAILLDVMMPQMDGFATLQQLRANTTTQHIPVILLTAKGRSLDQNQLTQLNVRGTISKPFNPRKLVDQVLMLLSETN